MVWQPKWTTRHVLEAKTFLQTDLTCLLTSSSVFGLKAAYAIINRIVLLHKEMYLPINICIWQNKARNLDINWTALTGGKIYVRIKTKKNTFSFDYSNLYSHCYHYLSNIINTKQFNVPVFCEEINIARTHMDSLYRLSGSFVLMPKWSNVTRYWPPGKRVFRAVSIL